MANTLTVVISHNPRISERGRQLQLVENDGIVWIVPANNGRLLQVNEARKQLCTERNLYSRERDGFNNITLIQSKHILLAPAKVPLQNLISCSPRTKCDFPSQIQNTTFRFSAQVQLNVYDWLKSPRQIYPKFSPF